MKIMIRCGMASAFLGLLAVQTSVKANSLTNNFLGSANYIANGIIGETNWDGVYMKGGDIYQGTTSGGNTVMAQEVQAAGLGFLEVQDAGASWSGSQDDGFFVYKVVKGDFDVSVDVTFPFDNQAYHLPGLLVRAYNPNNSGSPYSTNGTVSENWMYIARFDAYGQGDHGRYATNNNDFDGWFTTPGDAGTFPGNGGSQTNADNWIRITRVGDTFSFYNKTNQTDAWNFIASLARPDLDGVAMQVGLEDNTAGAGSTPTTLFTGFVLSGTNVTFPVIPPAPAAVVTTATNIGGSITFSWTKGNSSDSSLVVVSQRQIQHNPVNGIAYNADNAYGDNNALLDGAGEYVVYSGTNNSVTVTNLAGNNLTYNVTVYEYSGSGSSSVYNTAAVATKTVPGPGQIIGVTGSMISTNIPVGGADIGELFATFSSGSGTVDESTSSQTVWTSSDPTIASISGRVLTGLKPGTVTVVGTFNNTFSATNTVTVHGPVFTDNFSQNQDYVANGLAGSAWDGLFLNYGDVPNAQKGPPNAIGQTGILNANISSNGVLTVQSAGSAWYVNGANGPFLFKVVTGDFQASVHVGTESIINFFDAGIMARLYDNTGGATEGGGGGAGGTETHINWVKIQNGIPAIRRTIDSGGTTIVNGLSAADGWLLMQRVNSTNFYMYESSNPSNGWTFVTNMIVAEAANNAPMEVGIVQEMRAAGAGAGQLDHMMIDGAGLTPPATPPPPATNIMVTLNNNLSMTFDWVAASATGAPIRSLLVMRAGAPVTAFPTLAQAGSIGGTGTPVTFGTGLNLSGDNWLVFATGNPAASTNVTCTVQGLTPGVTYYAAVVTFTGSGGNKSFNTVLTSSGHTNLQDGSLLSIQTLPLPSIPRGGIGQLQVMGVFQGGAEVNVSPFATLTTTNSGIVAITNGALTGMSDGTATIKVVYSGFTNQITVMVREPAFVDQFTNGFDFLNNGVAGTPYDGVYNPNAATGVEIPESTYVPLTLSGATAANESTLTNVTITATNITLTSTNYTYVTNLANVLTFTSAGDGWENDAAGGLFLFKYVPGDFQMAVHIYSLQVAAYNQPGILARAYSMGTNGTDIGSPLTLGLSTNFNGTVETAGESWVDLSRFDEYGIGTYARLNTDGAVLQSFQNDQGDGDYWLLIVRSGGTNFNFYKRLTNNAPWQLLPLQTSYQVPEFAGVPMQVGLMAGPWTGGGGTANTVQYDYFMLDAAPATLQASVSSTNINLSWPAVPGFVLQQSSSLGAPNWLPVNGTFITNAESITISRPMTNSVMFFRLAP